MRRTPRLLAATLLAVLVLTGCTTPASPTPPPPSPEPTPVFASDEEALAAAEKAYAAYIATVDAILRDGGSSPERLQPLVAADLYERELAGFEEMSSKGWRGVGQRTFELTLQQYSNLDIVVYSCENVSATDVVDSSGTSVVSGDRPDTYLFEVGISDESGRWLISSKEVWQGDSAC